MRCMSSNVRRWHFAVNGSSSFPIPNEGDGRYVCIYGEYGEKREKKNSLNLVVVRQVAKCPIQEEEGGPRLAAHSLERHRPFPCAHHPISIAMHTDVNGAVVNGLHPLSIPHNVTSFLGLPLTALQ